MSRVLWQPGQYIESPRLRVLSLGAGVQSTAMLYMAIDGDIAPPPAAVIFADTGWEPESVYDHVKKLKEICPFPFYVVNNGNLRTAVMEGMGRKFAALPYFVREDGKTSMLRRQCTREYKIEPIHRKIRELCSLKKGQHFPKSWEVESWHGITTDEVERMKPSRMRWEVTRYPLIQMRYSRRDCRRYLEDRGLSVPHKSACIVCPFHSNAVWATLKQSNEKEWQEAVSFDYLLREQGVSGVTGTPYLHRSCVPLDKVDFSAQQNPLFDGFINECEGMCGV